MITKIKEFFRKRAQKKAEKIKRIEAKVDEVCNEYQELINEFALIEKKESKLSKKERDFVCARVAHLISKGHIKFNPPIK